jgi:hypothetical protein
MMNNKRIRLLLIAAVAISFDLMAPPAFAGRLSPYPPNRITVHEKKFDAITAFMKKRGFESDFWVTEQCSAPEFKWFYRVYSPKVTAKVLVMFTKSGELQTKLFVPVSSTAPDAEIIADLTDVSTRLNRKY